MTHQNRSRRILLGFTALALLSSCAVLENPVRTPEVSLGSARIVSMSLTETQLAFDVDVRNPNPIGIAMRGLSYRLAIQDKPLFDGNQSNGLKIGANGTSRVTLPFTLRHQDVLGSLAALRGSQELRYRISGDADFGLITLPYSKAGSFTLPRLPDVAVQGLRVRKLTLTGADLALDIKVSNANGFPVRFEGLTYDVKVAGTSLLQGQSSQPLAVGARGSGAMTLALAVNYAQLGSVAPKLRDAKSLPVEFRSQVKLPGPKGGDALVPYHWHGTVPLSR
jgi:LEA14-like dessication related protein